MSRVSAHGMMKDHASTRGRRANSPVFEKILPSAMLKLVEDGLFIKDDTADGGYRITDKGKQLLKNLGD